MTKRQILRASERVEIDGETYTLVFDINAMADLESVHGGNAFDHIDGLIRGDVTAGLLRALMWAQLQEKHKDLSLRDAGVLVSKTPEAALSAVIAAVQKAMPTAEEAGEAPENPPKVQTAA
jgi:hypothetical protein